MKDHWFDFTVEEYKTIRAETIEAKKGQQTSLRIGVATIGITIGLGFNLWGNELLAKLVFLTFIPLYVISF